MYLCHIITNKKITFHLFPTSNKQTIMFRVPFEKTDKAIILINEAQECNYDCDCVVKSICGIMNITSDKVIDYLVDAIRRCMELQKFMMKRYRMDITKWKRIMDALFKYHYHNLEYLDVSENIITQNGRLFNNVLVLKELFPANLRTLDLSNGCIDDVVSCFDFNSNMISKYLRETSTLHHLTMNHCYFTQSAYTEVLHNGIAKNRTLRTLTLNHIWGFDSMMLYRVLKRHPTIWCCYSTYLGYGHRVKIHEKRNDIRTKLIGKVALLLFIELLPTEMSTKIIRYLDIPTIYVHI